MRTHHVDVSLSDVFVVMQVRSGQRVAADIVGYVVGSRSVDYGKAVR